MRGKNDPFNRLPYSLRSLLVTDVDEPSGKISHPGVERSRLAVQTAMLLVKCAS